MSRAVQSYGFNGLAGCVEQRRSRESGTLVGLYHGEQSGLELDPDGPWVTVCEDHGTLVSHRTLAHARDNLPHPVGWCDACREAEDPTPTDDSILDTPTPTC